MLIGTGFVRASTGECDYAGYLVVDVTKGAKAVTNIEQLLTWRAACAEQPPVGIGTGELRALCEGDLVSKNGNSRRIFYWYYVTATGDEKIGYHLCDF